MNTRRQTKYAALVISILSASLINEYLLKLIKSYYEEPTYKSVVIGMLATLIVFFPLFNFLSKWIGKVSKVYVNTGKRVSSARNIGLYVSFIFALFILFVLYAQNRHGLDVLARLKQLFS
ncbi:hypothetical protein [Abyssalbus ytuae]|uniref:Uncharacterized protein n=1 Tax=Abyssalbus ytuae TaxID=2926907 RepID=A0A9E6ZTF3_9FLAO|nr:hypothetical protein [Abyssalbus ytuae]UOB18543.1 hypothetical protein MQE35_04460 [Abyssalbus ytuae]